MSERIFNFSSGPATLPLPALEEAQRDLLALPGAGISILEISHRSKQFDDILNNAQENLKRLLNVPDNYKVMFVHGGASLQFSMIAMNFLRESGKPANYIVTGSWGEKAIQEAQREGEAKAIWSGKSDNFTRTPAPSEYNVDSNAAYVHFTSNETIQGVEFMDEPPVGDIPLLCDASSDILSRPIDVSKYAMIYGGAQKNVGPSGTAVVILREDMIDRIPKNLHSLLDYGVYAKNNSVYNTPSTFAIYMINLTSKWLLELGGVRKMHDINQKKAAMLYDAIDQSNGFYQGHAKPECRSIMNVTWRMKEELEKEFVAEAKQRGMVELKGHRSVGGMRASIYNAMPVEGVERLRDFMVEFQKTKG